MDYPGDNYLNDRMERLDIGTPELGLLANMLRKVDFFTPLTVRQLERVLSHALLYSYGAGETVFRQGRPGDAFYIIYKGRVDVRLKSFLWCKKTVAVLGPGDFFGEIALISNEPRNATVTCAESTLLFTFISEDFRFILQENPAAAAEMRGIAARRKFDSASRSAS